MKELADREVLRLIEHLNDELASDKDCSEYLPIAQDPAALYKATADGHLLCRLLTKSLFMDQSLTALDNSELDRAISTIKEKGHATLIEGDAITAQDPLAVQLFVWQAIKMCLLKPVSEAKEKKDRIGSNFLLSRKSIRTNPKTDMNRNDSTEVPTKAPAVHQDPEQLLLGWMNNELSLIGYGQQMRNFGRDCSDSLAIAYLLNTITKMHLGQALLDLPTLMRQMNLTKRAEIVLESAKRIGCAQFATAQDIVNGNELMNMAFIAQLHNTHTYDQKPASFVKATKSFAPSSPSTVTNASPTSGSPMSKFWLTSLSGIIDTKEMLRMFEKIPISYTSSLDRVLMLLSDLNHEKHDAEIRIKAVDEKATFMEIENKNLKGLIDMLEQSEFSSMTQNTNARDSVDVKNKALVQANTLLEHKTAEMSTATEQMNEENERLLAELTRIRRQSGRNVDQTSKIIALEAELTALRGEKNDDEERSDIDSVQVTSLKAENAELNRQLNDVINDKDEQIEILSEAYERVKIGAAKVEKTLRSAQQEIVDARVRLNDQFKAKESMKKELATISQQFDAFKSSEAVNDATASNKQDPEQEKRVHDLTSENNVLTAKLQSFVEKFKLVDNHMQTLNVEYQRLLSLPNQEENELVIKRLKVALESKEDEVSILISNLATRNAELPVLQEVSTVTSLVEQRQALSNSERFTSLSKVIGESLTSLDMQKSYLQNEMSNSLAEKILAIKDRDAHIVELQSNIAVLQDNTTVLSMENSYRRSGKKIDFSVESYDTKLHTSLKAIKSAVSEISGNISIDVEVLDVSVKQLILRLCALQNLTYDQHAKIGEIETRAAIETARMDANSTELLAITALSKTYHDMNLKLLFECHAMKLQRGKIERPVLDNLVFESLYSELDSKYYQLQLAHNHVLESMIARATSMPLQTDIEESMGLLEEIGDAIATAGAQKSDDIIRKLEACSRALGCVSKKFDLSIAGLSAVVFSMQSRDVCVGNVSIVVEAPVESDAIEKINVAMQISNNDDTVLIDQSVVKSLVTQSEALVRQRDYYLASLFASRRELKSAVDLNTMLLANGHKYYLGQELNAALDYENEIKIKCLQIELAASTKAALQARSEILAVSEQNRSHFSEISRQCADDESVNAVKALEVCYNAMQKENVILALTITDAMRTIKRLEEAGPSNYSDHRLIAYKDQAVQLECLMANVVHVMNSGNSNSAKLSFKAFSDLALNALRGATRDLSAATAFNDTLRGYHKDFLILKHTHLKTQAEEGKAYISSAQKAIELTRQRYEELKIRIKSGPVSVDDASSIMLDDLKCLYENKEVLKSVQQYLWWLFEECTTKDAVIAEMEGEIYRVRSPGDKVDGLEQIVKDQARSITVLRHEVHRRCDEGLIVFNALQRDVGETVDSSLRLKMLRRMYKLTKLKEKYSDTNVEFVESIDDTLKFIKASFELVIRQDAYRNYLVVNLQTIEALNVRQALGLRKAVNVQVAQQTTIDQLRNENQEVVVRVDAFVKDSATKFERLIGIVSGLKAGCGELDTSQRSGIFGKKKERGGVVGGIAEDLGRLAGVLDDLNVACRALKNGVFLDTYSSIDDAMQRDIEQKLDNARRWAGAASGQAIDAKDRSDSMTRLKSDVNGAGLVGELIEMLKTLFVKITAADCKISVDRTEIEVLNSQNSAMAKRCAGLDIDAVEMARQTSEASAKLAVFKAELNPTKINSVLHLTNKKEYLESLQVKGAVDGKKLMGLYGDAVDELEVLYGVLIGMSTFGVSSGGEGVSFLREVKEEEEEEEEGLVKGLEETIDALRAQLRREDKGGNTGKVEAVKEVKADEEEFMGLLKRVQTRKEDKFRAKK